MFGPDLVVPKKEKHEKRTLPHDVLLPGLSTGYYQHVAREPNTNYPVRYLHYKQAKNATYSQVKNNDQKELDDEAFLMKYDELIVKKQRHREINERVKQKLQDYEDSLAKRKERLQELLSREQKEYFYETATQAQKGEMIKVEEQKMKAQQLRAQREAERLELVREKRMEQYKKRCQELRPALVHKRLIESKRTQLQQMRDNEVRREAERELDKMWYELSEKDRISKIEREQQDLLEKQLKQKEVVEVWDKQVRGKELMKEEMEQVAREDRLEMQKLEEKLRREKIAALDEKSRKRDERAREINEQIAIEHERLARRKEAENKIDEAFLKLAQLEIDREKAKQQDFTTQAKLETALYRKALQELNEERKKEEEELNELLEFHKKEVQKKQDEARCKLVEAKRKLQCDVLNQRAEQLEHKRQIAQEQLNLKEAENELMRMAFETNQRLDAEQERQAALAKAQHRADLLKQIEYNNILRKREQAELQRQLDAGMKDEEEYRKIIDDMVRNVEDISGVHPFRRVLERYDCSCPPRGPI